MGASLELLFFSSLAQIPVAMLGVGFIHAALASLVRLPSVLDEAEREFLATHSLGATKPNSHHASLGVDGTQLLLPT